MRTFLLGVAVFSLSLILSFNLRGEKGRECRVETKEVIRSVYGSGRVKGERQVLLKASVSGYVKRVLVKEGEKVRKGQLLIVIDSGGLENRLRSVEEKIELLKGRLDPDSPFLKSLHAQLEIRKENMEEARRRFMRRKRLFEKGALSRETMEEARRLYEVAKREYEAFKSSIEDRVEEIEREVSSLEEEKNSLLKELEKYKVKSPMDGVVLGVYVEEGDFVNQLRENDLLSLSSLKRKVVLEIDEEFLPLIKKGQKVFITTDAVPEKVFEGRVKSYNLESEPTRRIVKVEVEISLPEKVPVNSVVEGNVLISRFKTTVVPLKAVKGGYVYLLVNGEKRKVKVERVFDNYAEVIGYPPGTPCLF